MGYKTSAVYGLLMFSLAVATPALHTSGDCNQPPTARHLPPIPTRPPHVKNHHRHTIPRPQHPVVGNSPPAVVNPPPYAGGLTPPSGGVPATIPPPSTAGKCSIDVLKLGLCLDVLGLVHLGIRPVENFCCPVLEGLLEAEAALCLCTAIRLRVLNLNIYIPLALNVLVTCGKDPPPGYFCPAL